MQNSVLLLLANASVTWFLVGLIWIVQVVHYPLFANVGSQQYQQYQSQHQTLITMVVGPTMLIELLSAIGLIWLCPSAIPKWLVYVGLGLVLVIWLSTAFVQVPCHEKLTLQFDANVHAWLVNSNWIRTIAWTARGLIAIWMLACVLQETPVQ